MLIKINLIPEYRKNDIKKSLALIKVLKWEIELVTIFIFFICALASMNYILKINLFTLNNIANLALQSSNQLKTIEKYDRDIKGMNELLSDVSKIQSAQLYWSNLLLKINAKMVSGITIESLSTRNYSVSLAGKAVARDDLISLKEKMGEEECFTDIDLPLSNLVSKTDVQFQINFQLKKECLENGSMTKNE